MVKRMEKKKTSVQHSVDLSASLSELNDKSGKK